MGDYSSDTDPQHSSGIRYTRTIQRHLDNPVCHAGLVRFAEAVELETVVTIPATITLETTTGFAMAVNQLT